MTATVNGKPTRKQLGDQLDCLDGILDVLADALPQAVADACREGAKQAMKDVMLELLTHPDVRTRLATGGVPPHVPASPPADPKPSWWGRLKEKVKGLRDAVAARTRLAVTAVALTARMLTAVLPARQIALVTVGVGLAVGLIALTVHRLCPPGVAATASGVGAAVATAVAQAAASLRRAGLLAAR